MYVCMYVCDTNVCMCVTLMYRYVTCMYVTHMYVCVWHICKGMWHVCIYVCDTYVCVVACCLSGEKNPMWNMTVNQLNNFNNGKCLYPLVRWLLVLVACTASVGPGFFVRKGLTRVFCCVKGHLYCHVHWHTILCCYALVHAKNTMLCMPSHILVFVYFLQSFKHIVMMYIYWYIWCILKWTLFYFCGWIYIQTKHL